MGINTSVLLVTLNLDYRRLSPDRAYAKVSHTASRQTMGFPPRRWGCSKQRTGPAQQKSNGGGRGDEGRCSKQQLVWSNTPDSVLLGDWAHVTSRSPDMPLATNTHTLPVFTRTCASNPIESAHYPNTFNWFGLKTVGKHEGYLVVSTGDGAVVQWKLTVSWCSTCSEASVLHFKESEPRQ